MCLDYIPAWQGEKWLLLLVAVTFPHLQASETTTAMTGPWLTTSKAHQILKLYCTIPVHMAIRDQWHRIDGLEISFQPDHTGHHRKYMYTSLASVTSGMYDKPKRAEGLHPMAQVEGMVSVRNLSDSRPYYLSILMPFDFENGDAGTYFCVLNFTDAQTNGGRKVFQINTDKQFAYKTFTAGDRGLSGTLIQVDKIDITWLMISDKWPQPKGSVEQFIVGEDERKCSQRPRVLLHIWQEDIRDKDPDVLLAELSSSHTYPAVENFTLSLYAAQKLCYPYCKYSCEISGHKCITNDQAEVTSHLSTTVPSIPSTTVTEILSIPSTTVTEIPSIPSATDCSGCFVPWVLFGVAAFIIVILIYNFCSSLHKLHCCKTNMLKTRTADTNGQVTSSSRTPGCTKTAPGTNVYNSGTTSIPTAGHDQLGTVSGSHGNTEDETDQSLERQHRGGAAGGSRSIHSEAAGLVEHRDDPEEEQKPQDATNSEHYKQDWNGSNGAESQPLLRPKRMKGFPKDNCPYQMSQQQVSLLPQEHPASKDSVTSNSGLELHKHTHTDKLINSALQDGQSQYKDNVRRDGADQQIWKPNGKRTQDRTHGGPNPSGARCEQGSWHAQNTSHINQTLMQRNDTPSVNEGDKQVSVMAGTVHYQPAPCSSEVHHPHTGSDSPASPALYSTQSHQSPPSVGHARDEGANYNNHPPTTVSDTSDSDNIASSEELAQLKDISLTDKAKVCALNSIATVDFI